MPVWPAQAGWVVGGQQPVGPRPPAVRLTRSARSRGLRWPRACALPAESLRPTLAPRQLPRLCRPLTGGARRGRRSSRMRISELPLFGGRPSVALTAVLDARGTTSRPGYLYAQPTTRDGDLPARTPEYSPPPNRARRAHPPTRSGPQSSLLSKNTFSAATRQRPPPHAGAMRPGLYLGLAAIGADCPQERMIFVGKLLREARPPT